METNTQAAGALTRSPVRQREPPEIDLHGCAVLIARDVAETKVREARQPGRDAVTFVHGARGAYHRWDHKVRSGQA